MQRRRQILFDVKCLNQKGKWINNQTVCVIFLGPSHDLKIKLSFLCLAGERNVQCGPKIVYDKEIIY